MSSHPDADAFVRACLRNPPDVTARLVFADWLEETGTPSNVAWAHFIRAKAESSRAADQYAPHIRARLMIAAAPFVSRYESLLQLLPGPNITVRLAGYEIPRAVVELVPESVTRENVVVPLKLQGRMLIVCQADATNTDTVQKVEFILNKDVVAVRAELDDIVDSINRHYGQTETESVDCVLYESPLIGLEGGSESHALFSIFHTAFVERATGFELHWGRTDCTVRYMRGSVPVRTETYPRAVYSHLLKHLLSLTPDAMRTERSLRCLDLDVPLLSGRQFPTTLEYEPSWRGPKWFRLQFRW